MAPVCSLHSISHSALLSREDHKGPFVDPFLQKREEIRIALTENGIDAVEFFRVIEPLEKNRNQCISLCQELLKLDAQLQFSNTKLTQLRNQSEQQDLELISTQLQEQLARCAQLKSELADLAVLLTETSAELNSVNDAFEAAKTRLNDPNKKKRQAAAEKFRLLQQKKSSLQTKRQEIQLKVDETTKLLEKTQYKQTKFGNMFGWNEEILLMTQICAHQKDAFNRLSVKITPLERDFNVLLKEISVSLSQGDETRQNIIVQSVQKLILCQCDN